MPRPPVRKDLPMTTDRMKGYRYTRYVNNCFNFKTIKCFIGMTLFHLKQYKFKTIDTYYLKVNFFDKYHLIGVIFVFERKCGQYKYVFKRWNNIFFYDTCSKKRLYVIHRGDICPLEVLDSIDQLKNFLPNKYTFTFFFVPNFLSLSIDYNENIINENVIFKIGYFENDRYSLFLYYQDNDNKTLFMQSKIVEYHKDFFAN